MFKMSRSRKKNPYISDYSRSYTRYAKRQASKSFRQKEKKAIRGVGEFPKKPAETYDSWNICDWKFLDEKREYRMK